MTSMTVQELKEVFEANKADGMAFRTSPLYKNELWLIETDWRKELSDKGIEVTSLEMQVLVDWLMALPEPKVSFTRI